MSKTATIDKPEVKQSTTARLGSKSIKLDFDPKDEQKTIRTVIPFEMKSLNDDERTIEFIGSTATVDRYGDSITQAGWEIGNFTKNPVVPWGHDYSQPPVAQATEVGLRDGNLFFKAKFATAEEYAFADTIYKLYKGGYLRAFSVGFIPLEYSGNWEDGYVFTKCELLEVSCVTVPANPEALTLAFREGVVSDDEKRTMIKRAQKLISSLTDEGSSSINEGMNKETKAYIDEELKGIHGKLDQLLAKSAQEDVEEPESEQPPVDTNDSANPSEGADGGTDEVDEEQVRSAVRDGLKKQLGIID